MRAKTLVMLAELVCRWERVRRTLRLVLQSIFPIRNCNWVGFSFRVFWLRDVRLLWVPTAALWFLIFVFILRSLPWQTKPACNRIFGLDPGLNLVFCGLIVQNFLKVVFAGPFLFCKWWPLLFRLSISKFCFLAISFIHLSFLCCLRGLLFLGQGLGPPLAQFLFNFHLPALTYVVTFILLHLFARYVWLIQ